MKLRLLTLLIFGLILGGGYVYAGGLDNGFQCLQCHSDKIPNGSSHFIQSGDDCLFCHNVDMTQVSYASHKVLTMDQDEVCQACHGSTGGMITTVGHESLRCVECHNPHGSRNEHMLTNAPISLCSESCHTSHELGRSHPVGAGITDINTGSTLTCTSTCHTVHHPKEENNLLQLTATDLCRSCHRGKF